MRCSFLTGLQSKTMNKRDQSHLTLVRFLKRMLIVSSCWIILGRQLAMASSDSKTPIQQNVVSLFYKVICRHFRNLAFFALINSSTQSSFTVTYGVTNLVILNSKIICERTTIYFHNFFGRTAVQNTDIRMLSCKHKRRTVMVGYDDIHSQCFKDTVGAYQKVRRNG